MLERFDILFLFLRLDCKVTLKKWPVKPSGPGELSGQRSQIAVLTSSMVGRLQRERLSLGFRVRGILSRISGYRSVPSCVKRVLKKEVASEAMSSHSVPLLYPFQIGFLLPASSASLSLSSCLVLFLRMFPKGFACEKLKSRVKIQSKLKLGLGHFLGKVSPSEWGILAIGGEKCLQEAECLLIPLQILQKSGSHQCSMIMKVNGQVCNGNPDRNDRSYLIGVKISGPFGDVHGCSLDIPIFAQE
ncbi:unnamed protein product [Cuscuta campestris]|uniref:Uncharacterized protein n=1 Tax=Cuscuta campestris TaxID=132261 RepID=A0A484K266_9ASTE|nr:unnamed protein product [Cuscuta campestris]